MNTLKQNIDQKEKNTLIGQPLLSTDGSYLLLPNEDNDILSIPDLTHSGAFGSDYIPVIIEDNNIIYNNINSTFWLIWKIPSDLSSIISLPYEMFFKVGKYSVENDINANVIKGHEKIIKVKKNNSYPIVLKQQLEKQFKRNEELSHLFKGPQLLEIINDSIKSTEEAYYNADEDTKATKNRMVKRDENGIEQHLHFLEYDDGTKYAMVSSSLFLKDGLRGKWRDLNIISSSLNSPLFSNIIDIKAVSCHKMHHALVFQHSPRNFAIILREKPEILNFLKEQVDRFGGNSVKVELWCNSFIEYFTSPRWIEYLLNHRKFDFYI